MANELGHETTIKFKKGSAAFSINQSSIIYSRNPHKAQQIHWIPNLSSYTKIHNIHAISKHMSQ